MPENAMRKARWAYVSVLLLLLCGCEDGEKSKYQQKVLDRLVDPYTAHFRDVSIVSAHTKEGSSWRGLCGQLNAKNRSGGYVGNHYFAYTISFQASKKNRNNETLLNMFQYGQFIEVPLNPKCDFIIDYKQRCEPSPKLSDDDFGLIPGNDRSCQEPLDDTIDP
ncbi:MAG TPA: hypothetical protein VG248_09535 [Caulobacteraceae bacterium]|jgi:hypothetical protein|nr:hypothetical protein [Caulobacteraceae bacterium]